MYEQHDPLKELHDRNVGSANVSQPPRYGTLNPSQLVRAEYAFI
jgi:hypothetical protein